jgi:hypothetical protein
MTSISVLCFGGVGVGTSVLRQIILGSFVRFISTSRQMLDIRVHYVVLSTLLRYFAA